MAASMNKLMCDATSQTVEEFDEDIVNEIVVSDSREEGPSNGLNCMYCDKSFTRRSNLLKHVRKVHKQRFVHVESGGKIICAFKPECTSTFHRTAVYRQHLQITHNVKIQKVVMRFTSFDEFLLWKAQEEAKTQSRYNKSGKIVDLCAGSTVDIKKAVYICCRTGASCIKGVKKKRCSLKINAYCPAKMDVIYSPDRVILVYFRTHVGHGNIREIYATSERRRLKQAEARQKRRYATLKAEVRSKIEKFLEALDADQYGMDYLKYVTKKLDCVFNPDLIRGDSTENGEQSEQNSISACEKATNTPPFDETAVDDYANIASSSQNGIPEVTSSSILPPGTVVHSSLGLAEVTNYQPNDHSYDMSASKLQIMRNQPPVTLVPVNQQPRKLGTVLSVSYGIEQSVNSVVTYVLHTHFSDMLIDNFTSMIWENPVSLEPAPEHERKRYESVWDSFRNKRLES